MPHLPESARLWLERSEIDYIGPFVKSWASFNAWYREASGDRKDFKGLEYVKQQANPVRSAIMPLIQPARIDGHGNTIPDGEAAQKFKLLLRDLHVGLDAFHIEVLKNDVLERISFRSICLHRGASIPQTHEYRRLRYRIDKVSGGIWKSSICSVSNPANIKCTIEQTTFDADHLQEQPDFANLSLPQRSQLLALYKLCNPRPMIDLFDNGGERIVAGDIEFQCSDQQLFSATIEIIYAMRNALLHGELQPHKQAFSTYEPAYRILMQFLHSLRN